MILTIALSAVCVVFMLAWLVWLAGAVILAIVTAAEIARRLAQAILKIHIGALGTNFLAAHGRQRRSDRQFLRDIGVRA